MTDPIIGIPVMLFNFIISYIFVTLAEYFINNLIVTLNMTLIV